MEYPLADKMRIYGQTNPVNAYHAIIITLWFQLQDTVLLIGTFLLFDPVLFPIYEA